MFSQSFQIIGPKNYLLKEGDSIKVAVKNLLKSDQTVSVKILNPDANHLHFFTNASDLDYLNLPYNGVGDSTVFDCLYYPKSLHPFRAQIIINNHKNIQHDTATISTVDTSDGTPDPLRTKEYLNLLTEDTISFYTHRAPFYFRHATIKARSKTNELSQGYVMVESGSGNFRTAAVKYIMKFTSGPFEIGLDYMDTFAYGHRDTARVILYPLIPRDARPDTVMVFAANDDITLNFDSPDFYNVARGVKICRPGRIINNNDSSVLITSVNLTDPYFSIEPPLGLPLLLSAHKDLSFTICFSAPDSEKYFGGCGMTVFVDPFTHRSEYSQTGFPATIDNECLVHSEETIRFKF